MDRIVADTNVLAHLLAGDRRAARLVAKKKVVVSFVTDIELHAHPSFTREDEQRIDRLLDDRLIIGFDDKVRRTTITIRRDYRLEIPDAIIAATARILGIPLATADKTFLKCAAIIDIQFLKR